MERLRFEKYNNFRGTPPSSRFFQPKLQVGGVRLECNFEEKADDLDDKDWTDDSAAAAACRPSSQSSGDAQTEEDHRAPETFDVCPVRPSFSAQPRDEDEILSPVSATKEEAGSDGINLERFPAKRPSSISLFSGFSSEESSEQGIFGVTAPELIDGDMSLALSIPTSSCTSPEALDNESSLGLLTPSHLQDCWNSNANDDDIYQHLRSPSVDDLEEFEEEDKTVDQDLSDFTDQASSNFRKVMSSSLSGTIVVNQNVGLAAVHHPMHHSLHEGLLTHGQGRVRRDRTYTQLPTVPNLNQHHHAPLSFRGSGSGSGSGYYASDPFTDSDFNTESEADHDHDEQLCSSASGSGICSNAVTNGIANATSLKNRGARVIDGALYTSHHHASRDREASPSHSNPLQSHHHQQQRHPLHQQQQQQPLQHPQLLPNGAQKRQESGGPTGAVDTVAKCIDMISSGISFSVSSNSASACASEMESSGVYSDASERNPSGGGSVMSESDGYRSSRHLSKSSSDCDDSVALSLGMKLETMKPLTQSEDLVGYSNGKEIIQILSASSIYDDLSNSSDLNGSFVSDHNRSSSNNHTRRAEVSSSSTTVEEHDDCLSPKKVAIVKTNPPTVEYQKDRGQHTNEQCVPYMMTLSAQQHHEEEQCEDWGEEDMDVDLFEESFVRSENEMDTFSTTDEPVHMKTNEPSVMNTSSAEDANNLGHGLITRLGAVASGTLDDPIILDSTLESDAMEVELELCPEVEGDTNGSKNDDTFHNESSMGTGPMIMSAPEVVVNSGLHGNTLETDGSKVPDGGGGGVGLGTNGGGGGGFACFRSQSFNCIASLTSSTSSASTVTAKSCVTAGGSSSTVSRATKGPTSSKNKRAPSMETLSTFPCGESNSSSLKKRGNVKEARGGKSTAAGSSTNNTGGKHGKDGGAKQGGGNSLPTTTKPGSAGTSAAPGSSDTVSAAGSSGNNVTAEQSSVVSTTSGRGTRRTSRLAATGGKSAGGVGARKGDSRFSTASTISSSSELSRTSRSARSNVHGSTRSLASVGLAPSSANTSFASSVSPAAKKNNKWDAVMSKIAETKHKTINVKDVKSKVFNSGAKSTTAGNGPGSSTAAASGSSSTNNSAGSSGKMTKGAKTATRAQITDRCNENNPLVPPAVHRRQHHFSSRSSTISDSSLDDQPYRAPPPAKHRAKKDTTINRRQVSDLSSASEYSATQSSSQAATAPASKGRDNTTSVSLAGSNPSKVNMTTGSARRNQRTAASNKGGGATSAGASNGTKSSSSTASSSNSASATSSSVKSQGTKSATTAPEVAKKRGANLSHAAPTRKGITSKSKVGSSTVSAQTDPSTKSHPAVKPLRDRNRLGPLGKTYGPSGLDANANESAEAPLLNGQANGELDGKPCTNKVAGSGEPLIDSANVTSNNSSSNLIINKKSTNNRVSSTNQHNIQNSVLVQENSSLKEEVSRLTSVVSDLQDQIGRLTASGEETKKSLKLCLADSNTKCVALSVVAQHCDKERLGVYEQLVQQQEENKAWKQRLEEKLAELQNLQSEYEKEREQNKEEVRAITARHEVEVDVTVRNCENKLDEMQKRHDETLAELKRSHTEELERLQESQKQELEQTIQRHRELLDQHRNQSPHDILHKEVESLQVVVEMRNEDIRMLRKDLMDYKNTLNDLQMAREHGKSLVAKIEDLEAQLEKGRSDKRSLQERYQLLETSLQQAELEKERLVRVNDELNWKMKSYNLVEN